MRRGQLEARSQGLRRIRNRVMARLALLHRAAVLAGMRMVVQTDWHASYQNREVGTRDSGPHEVPGLP